MKIGGSTGNGNGTQVIEPLVHSLISPTFLAKITWSGRAGKGKDKKIALSKYANLVRVICEVSQTADKNYKPQSCVSDLKYKVIKYAHSKYSNENIDSKNGESKRDDRNTP